MRLRGSRLLAGTFGIRREVGVLACPPKLAAFWRALASTGSLATGVSKVSDIVECSTTMADVYRNEKAVFREVIRQTALDRSLHHPTSEHLR